ncbi:hypothetical protein L1987_06424 [Smallanthus sonchifolius]|uniref:Uncharacterized protein n=1 Tax=Smallanthus sonchifolius TaxID=185202 RepID=A0ACB9JY95_9ASTR|nr:hypothetical protein L1987_06424 [Smallanthus sonchifolius]
MIKRNRVATWLTSEAAEGGGIIPITQEASIGLCSLVLTSIISRGWTVVGYSLFRDEGRIEKTTEGILVLKTVTKKKFWGCLLNQIKDGVVYRVFGKEGIERIKWKWSVRKRQNLAKQAAICVQWVRRRKRDKGPRERRIQKEDYG